MTSPAAQESAARLLSDTKKFTVDARSCDRGDFLIVECSEAGHGLDVYEVVMMADAGAELIHSTKERDEWRDFMMGRSALNS